ncbi:nicotinamidase [Pelistega ratti]|uniref:nicotinamidase n=1 Tax=Pelistega ratti TaxID=2652177 RepID=UPI00135B4499|nr:nicotinamidase [Pelistega ratti]
MMSLAKSALIVVDIQTDFLPGGALACYQADSILKGVKDLVDAQYFDYHIATQDWHPAHHISFASQHEGKKAFDTISLYGHPQVLWPDHCIKGTAGAALDPTINWDNMDLILRKGCHPQVDSYSAFQENFNQKGERPTTGLAGYLKEKEVKNVYTVGLARDVCVLWTAQGAKEQGFNTFLIWDLCAPVTPDHDEITRQLCQEYGIQIIHAADIRY